MKKVTMDWKTYTDENRSNQSRGFKNGVGEARRVFLELLAGASIENLDVDDSELIKLAEDLKPRIDRAKKAAV